MALTECAIASATLTLNVPLHFLRYYSISLHPTFVHMREVQDHTCDCLSRLRLIRPSQEEHVLLRRVDVVVLQNEHTFYPILLKCGEFH